MRLDETNNEHRSAPCSKAQNSIAVAYFCYRRLQRACEGIMPLYRSVIIPASQVEKTRGAQLISLLGQFIVDFESDIVRAVGIIRMAYGRCCESLTCRFKIRIVPQEAPYNLGTSDGGYLSDDPQCDAVLVWDTSTPRSAFFVRVRFEISTSRKKCFP